MAHPRQLIRLAAQTALVNMTRADDRVITTQLRPYRSPQLPAIGIYTLKEEVDPASAQSAPRELKRHPRLVLEAVTRLTADSNIDDYLDGWAEEIEKAIAKDDTLGGTASDCWLSETEFEFGMQGDMEV